MPQPHHGRILNLNSQAMEIHLPNANESFQSVFHRMVLVDAIVISLSSFSVAAALLNNSTHPLVAPSKQHGGNREEWFRTSRFHRVSDGVPVGDRWMKTKTGDATDDSSKQSHRQPAHTKPPHRTGRIVNRHDTNQKHRWGCLGHIFFCCVHLPCLILVFYRRHPTPQ